MNCKADVEYSDIKYSGTSACPPYHLAIVIGGLSAEMTLKTVKMASTKYYDTLPTTGNAHGRAFRDVETEAAVLKLTQNMGIGAQFGGKYFCHDVRVIRLPRHGASCPVGLGVSCSADRQIKGKITAEGIFLEQLETDVGKYLPEVTDEHVSSDVVKLDINQPMSELRKQLSSLPVTTRLSLSGTMVVARDIAHAKILESLESGADLPQYMKDSWCTMPGQLRPQRDTHLDHLVLQQPVAWTHMSIDSWRLEGASSPLQKVIDQSKSLKHARNMVVSIWVLLAVQQLYWRRTV